MYETTMWTSFPDKTVETDYGKALAYHRPWPVCKHPGPVPGRTAKSDANGVGSMFSANGFLGWLRGLAEKPPRSGTLQFSGPGAEITGIPLDEKADVTNNTDGCRCWRLRTQLELVGV